MRVRAKLKVYYQNVLYLPGQEFVLVAVKGHKYDDRGKLVPLELTPAQQFSNNSMEKLDPSAAVRGPKAIGGAGKNGNPKAGSKPADA